MTENEALEILKNECNDISKVQIALKVAREALEEIQQYRAIGTVEHIQLTFELCKGLDCLVKMYEAIGTVEECRVAVEIVKKMYKHCEGSCADCPYHNPNIPDRCMNDLLK